MKSEYIGISGSGKIYTQKTFLQTELELLQILSNLQIFKQIRKEEFLLKISFKNKVEELLAMIANLERILPKSNFKFESADDRKRERELKRDLGLQSEIEAIREKIEELKRGI